MKIECVPVAGIVVGRRQRAADPAKVQEIAASIERVGLLQPITVYTPDDATVELVAGLHRLEAVRSLGRDAIVAVFVTGDATAREMAEIAENLHRSELTALERDEHIARWIELADIKRQATVLAQPTPKPRQSGRPESGTRAAARELGIDRDAARRAQKTASLSSEAKQVARDTGLADNRTALLSAARAATPEAQVAVLHQRAEGRASSEQREPDVTDLRSAWDRAVKPIWIRASHEVRLQFMATIAVEESREESRERQVTPVTGQQARSLTAETGPLGQPETTTAHLHAKDAGPIPLFLDRRMR